MGLTIRSQVALYTTVFLSCISFSIVLPSMWPYLHRLSSTKRFLAVVVAIYSVGEALGALFFGIMSSHFSTRFTMQSATVLGIIGSTLYVVAQLFPMDLGKYMVLFGRLLQGFWTGGAQAIQTSYFAAVLSSDQLTPAIVTLNAYACMGFVIGPVFGLFVDTLPAARLFFGMQMDALTSPGFFVLASGITAFLLFGFVFDEEKDREDVSALHGMEASEVGLPTEAQPLIPDGTQKEKAIEDMIPTPQLTVLVLCNIIFFIHFYGFAIQETITTPLVQSYYDWSVFTANLLFTVAGLCALISFFGVGFVTSTMSDRALTAFSLVLGAAGYMLLMSQPSDSLPIWRFLAGFVVISIAFPVGRATTTSMYTKLLPLKMQGQWQGILLATGAVARVFGPFWAVHALIWESGGVLVFGGSALLFVGCLVAMMCYYDKLRPST